jgi:hypothetical protein
MSKNKRPQAGTLLAFESVSERRETDKAKTVWVR